MSGRHRGSWLRVGAPTTRIHASPAHWFAERRAAWVHFGAVTWLLGVGVVVLLPALMRGAALGPYDVLSCCGLTQQAGVIVHSATPSDQIQQMIPWNMLAWQQVHSGQLPLWNQYSVLGMPLAFNWQSSVFSLPSVISYFGPLDLAFTIAVVVKIAIAGTGVYVLGRVLGLGAIASQCLRGDGFRAQRGVHGVVRLSDRHGRLLARMDFRRRCDCHPQGRQAGLESLVPRAGHCAVGARRQPRVVGLRLPRPDRRDRGDTRPFALLRDRRWRAIAGPLWRVGVGVLGGLALAAPLLLPGLQGRGSLGAPGRDSGWRTFRQGTGELRLLQLLRDADCREPALWSHQLLRLSGVRRACRHRAGGAGRRGPVPPGWGFAALWCCFWPSVQSSTAPRSGRFSTPCPSWAP